MSIWSRWIPVVGFSLALLLVPPALPGQEEEAPKPEAKRPEHQPPVKFTEVLLGFKIALPGGWTSKKSGKDTILFQGQKGDDGPAPQMKLQWKRVRTPFDEFVKSFKRTLREIEKEVAIEGENRVRSGRAEGTTFRAAGAERTTLFRILENGGVKYILSFTAENEPYQKQAESIEGALKSVRIFDVPDLSESDIKKFYENHEKAVQAVKDGKWNVALESFRKAAALIPDDPDLRLNIGLVCRMLNKQDDARREYQTVIKFDPDEVEAHKGLGSVYIAQKQYPKAIESLEKAASLDPTSGETLANLGAVHVLREHYDKAVEVLQKAIELDPTSIQSLFHCGFSHEMLGRLEDAEKMYKRVLETDPAHEGAKEGLGRLKK
ncbi:MAG: hypothetical protein A2Z34_07600 [Planctomycetes bacterium RBG_16_59_8]|nr:MAG: hypothetical protein A2Z34_07600 [Planctomycetes bacterium RBG_16_59_8]